MKFSVEVAYTLDLHLDFLYARKIIVSYKVLPRGSVSFK